MGKYWNRPRGRPVRNRRFDRLANLDPYDFERVVADYYRSQGYEVDHCGGEGRYDGGIDLKMRRDGEYTIVQCKRENANQVSHNVIHELLGVMVTEKADRAIVVNAGEFTRHARESADKEPRLELIDGDRVREMLPEYAQPVPEPEPVDDLDKYVFSVPVKDRAPALEPMVMTRSRAPSSNAKPFLPAALDRGVRKGPSRRRGNRSEGARAMMAFAVLAGLLAWQCSREPAQSRPSAMRGSPTATPAPAAPPRQQADVRSTRESSARASCFTCSKPARMRLRRRMRAMAGSKGGRCGEL